jgi:hypothetical protein
MPAHLSHILQLLNVGCFAPLKRAYSKEIRVTEHQLFQVSERSISIDFSFKHDSNAFVNLFSNVLPLLQALWRARCPILSFSSLLSRNLFKMARAPLSFTRSVEGLNHR